MRLAVTVQEELWGDTVRSWQHLVRNTMLRAQGTQEQDTKMSPKLCAKSNACSKLGSVLERGVAHMAGWYAHAPCTGSIHGPAVSSIYCPRGLFIACDFPISLKGQGSATLDV